MFGRLRNGWKVAHQQRSTQVMSKRLRSAVEKNNLKQVKKIVAAYGNVSAIVNAAMPLQAEPDSVFAGPSILILAARYGYADIVAELLKAPSINVNLIDDEVRSNQSDRFRKNTALLAAINHKHAHAAALLVARDDVDFSVRAGCKGTVLHCAVELCPSVVPSLLNKAGVDVNAQDVNGDTALHLACHSNYPIDNPSIESTKQLLMQPGLQLNVQNNQGWTPLMVAAKNNDETMVRLLLNAGADAWLQNEQGNTAADIASASGYDSISTLFEEILAQADPGLNPYSPYFSRINPFNTI